MDAPLWQSAGMSQIAGRLPLADVMAHLSKHRQVFHSEADFQFAFAQSVVALDDSIRVRLEVPQRAERSTYVDLLCEADQRSLIEFKYFTRSWAGSDALEEKFSLRGHAARDLARLSFVHDVTRLERWIEEQRNTNGFAVLLTNDNMLWEQPVGARMTRDTDFRLHEGGTLTGSLTWGTAERPYKNNDRTLRGTYRAAWRDFSQVDTKPGGTFRWLGWTVTV